MDLLGFARIAVEQGLLRTFGRVMPVLMPGSLLLGVAYAVAVVTTVLANVPIDLATGRWDAADPPADWQETRRPWERFQGIRSWLLLAGFVLLCAAATLRS